MVMRACRWVCLWVRVMWLRMENRRLERKLRRLDAQLEELDREKLRLFGIDPGE
ncbi:MAG: hypothetical protein U0792_07940 [Gemmataceae bacterium]